MKDGLYGEKETISTHWRKSTLDLFISVLEKYNSLISIESTDRTHKINEEIAKIDLYIEHISDYSGQSEDEYDWVNIPVSGKLMGTIVVLLEQELDYLKQELAKKKSRTFVEGALEEIENNIVTIEETLKLEIMAQVPRQKLLVDSIFLPEKKELVSPDSIQYHQTILGNVYGVVVTSNTGEINVTENASVKEIFALLNEITKTVEKSDLPSEIKQDAFSDIQAMQTQISKTKPSKNILTAAYQSLSSLANVAQTSDFYITHLEPKLGLLKAAIDSFTSIS